MTFARLGIKKLNTTAYHPQCDGMVERFNRTLKSMLRKHSALQGNQWDEFLPRVLWAYRNTPHDSTGEKPSYLLFGYDTRSPLEAELLPPTECHGGSVEEYREQLVTSLQSARDLAANEVKRAQKRYKTTFDKKAKQPDYRAGDLVLVYFPQEDTGKLRKLSRPWHGPHRVTSSNNSDVCVTKLHYPREGQIQVHQSRVSRCPEDWPVGYFWYGARRHSVGRPPKWVQPLLERSVGELDNSEAPTCSETILDD